MANDYLSRETILRCIMESRDDIDWGQSEDADAFLHYTGALYRSIASKECLPAADVVEVVRCGNCAVLQICRFAQGLGLDGYCSQGERRTDETDYRKE